MKDSKGRFIKVHDTVIDLCPCGNEVITTVERKRLGHGKYCSKNCFYGYRILPKRSDHHAWKGLSASYVTIHKWVARELGKPNYCEACHTKKANRFEWSNISGEYKRELSDWKRLCSRCHHAVDDIANRGWITRKAQINA